MSAEKKKKGEFKNLITSAIEEAMRQQGENPEKSVVKITFLGFLVYIIISRFFANTSKTELSLGELGLDFANFHVAEDLHEDFSSPFIDENTRLAFQTMSPEEGLRVLFPSTCVHLPESFVPPSLGGLKNCWIQGQFTFAERVEAVQGVLTGLAEQTFQLKVKEVLNSQPHRSMVWTPTKLERSVTPTVYRDSEHGFDQLESSNHDPVQHQLKRMRSGSWRESPHFKMQSEMQSLKSDVGKLINHVAEMSKSMDQVFTFISGISSNSIPTLQERRNK